MGEMFPNSAIAQMVEKQWKKWLLLTEQRTVRKPVGLFPTVTISRERGSNGSLIARLVADRLGFVVFDSEIVDHVARSAAVDRMVVVHMDEHSRQRIQEWTEQVMDRQQFSAETYMAHLTRTISTVGEKGRAVIIGRGAHLLLPVERCFRVRVIAPLPVRIARLVASGEPRPRAEAIIADTDQQRAQFIQENFRQSDADPLLYDLVINTGEIAMETAAEVIVRAVEAKFPQVLQVRGSAPVPASRLAE